MTCEQKILGHQPRAHKCTDSIEHDADFLDLLRSSEVTLSGADLNSLYINRREARASGETIIS